MMLHIKICKPTSIFHRANVCQRYFVKGIAVPVLGGHLVSGLSRKALIMLLTVLSVCYSSAKKLFSLYEAWYACSIRDLGSGTPSIAKMC